MDHTDKNNKDFNIIVNAREKTWLHKEITFDEIVVLACGLVENTVSYTVIFKKGGNNKPEGIIVSGDSIKVKDGMIFNVTQTSRS